MSTRADDGHDAILTTPNHTDKLDELQNEVKKDKQVRGCLNFWEVYARSVPVGLSLVLIF